MRASTRYVFHGMLYEKPKGWAQDRCLGAGYGAGAGQEGLNAHSINNVVFGRLEGSVRVTTRPFPITAWHCHRFQEELVVPIKRRYLTGGLDSGSPGIGLISSEGR